MRDVYFIHCSWDCCFTVSTNHRTLTCWPCIWFSPYFHTLSSYFGLHLKTAHHVRYLVSVSTRFGIVYTLWLWSEGPLFLPLYPEYIASTTQSFILRSPNPYQGKRLGFRHFFNMAEKVTKNKTKKLTCQTPMPAAVWVKGRWWMRHSLKPVRTDLREIVDQGKQCGTGEDGGEEEDVAKLHEHLQVIIYQTFRLQEK